MQQAHWLRKVYNQSAMIEANNVCMCVSLSSVCSFSWKVMWTASEESQLSEVICRSKWNIIRWLLKRQSHCIWSVRFSFFSFHCTSFDMCPSREGGLFKGSLLQCFTNARTTKRMQADGQRFGGFDNFEMKNENKWNERSADSVHRTECCSQPFKITFLFGSLGNRRACGKLNAVAVQKACLATLCVLVSSHWATNWKVKIK